MTKMTTYTLLLITHCYLLTFTYFNPYFYIFTYLCSHTFTPYFYIFTYLRTHLQFYLLLLVFLVYVYLFIIPYFCAFKHCFVLF